MLNSKNFMIHDCAKSEKDHMAVNNLLVEKNKTVVTDGHVLIEMSSCELNPSDYPEIAGYKPIEITEPLQFSKSNCQALLKNMPKKTSQSLPILNCIQIAENSTGPVALTHDLSNTFTVHAEKDPAQYPDYNKVIPKEEDCLLKIDFNPALMAKIMNHAVKLSENVTMLVPKSNAEPISFKSVDPDNNQTMKAFLMPMRGESNEEIAFSLTENKIKALIASFPKKDTIYQKEVLALLESKIDGFIYDILCQIQEAKPV
jgi:hypothetical protein